MSTLVNLRVVRLSRRGRHHAENLVEPVNVVDLIARNPVERRYRSVRTGRPVTVAALRARFAQHRAPAAWTPVADERPRGRIVAEPTGAAQWQPPTQPMFVADLRAMARAA